MKISLILIFAFFIIAGAFMVFSGKKLSTPEKSQKKKVNLNSRVRLTDKQIIALSSASFEKPIYGENPSFINAQMPGNSQAFNQITIDSLVKRGYLKSDGKGGYLLTPEGEDGLRSGMGF